MLEILKYIPIPAELGAFISFAIIFFAFRSKEMIELNKTLKKISDDNISNNQAIVRDFQEINREQNREIRVVQKNHQMQLQSLMDSHIRVSHEFISMLSEIKNGFQGIQTKFESIENNLKKTKDD